MPKVSVSELKTTVLLRGNRNMARPQKGLMLNLEVGWLLFHIDDDYGRAVAGQLQSTLSVFGS